MTEMGPADGSVASEVIDERIAGGLARGDLEQDARAHQGGGPGGTRGDQVSEGDEPRNTHVVARRDQALIRAPVAPNTSGKKTKSKPKDSEPGGPLEKRSQSYGRVARSRNSGDSRSGLRREKSPGVTDQTSSGTRPTPIASNLSSLGV